MSIQKSELIRNTDGSIYHLNLQPHHIANDLIFVGDQDRVSQVTNFFDSIEFTMQKREFKTSTGSYKGKRITVISTGIGPDNIDIVLNELDALVNIDLDTGELKKTTTALNIIRIGTSGSLQADIPVDTFVISTHGLDLNGMLHCYQIQAHTNPAFETAFIAHTQWHENKANPLLIAGDKQLENLLNAPGVFKGITATAGGFYGPQGRILRLPLEDHALNHKIDSFTYQGQRITNLEMETSAIYGLSKLLGHRACSINAILANRANGTFSKDSKKTIEKLIRYTLDKIVA